MAISYDAGTNTITVTGYSLATPCTLTDIYNADVAAGWGVVSRNNSHFTLACTLTIGDGTTATYLRDYEKQIHIIGGVFKVLAAARCQFGLPLGAAPYIKSYWGCQIFIENPNATYAISITGAIYLYGCYVLADTVGYYTGWSIGPNSASEIIDTTLEHHDANAGMWMGLANLRAYNVIIKRADWRVSGTPSVAPDQINCQARFVSQGTHTLRNSVIHGNVTTSVWHSNTFTLVDCLIYGSRSTGWNGAGGTGRDYLYEKYTFNLKIIDTDGNVIPEAAVSIVDINGIEIFSGTSDVNGEITEQELVYYWRWEQYGAIADSDEGYDTPHTVTISKTGYVTRTLIYTMDQARDEIEMLESEQLPPTAPSGLTATAVSQTQIDLAWTDNSSDETGFRVERSPNGSTLWTHITTTAAGATSYSDTGLACGTAYYYRVCAVNDNGNSDYTDVAHDSTDACTVPQVIIELESPIP